MTGLSTIYFRIFISTCLFLSFFPDLPLVTVMGWGKTKEYLSDSPTLETVTLNYVSFEQCRKDYNYANIRASMICAGVLGGGKVSY